MRPRSRACSSPPRRWWPKCRRRPLRCPRCRAAPVWGVWAEWAEWISELHLPDNKQRRDAAKRPFFCGRSIRRRAEAQCRTAVEREHIAAQAPGRDLRECDDHLLVRLSALGCARLFIHPAHHDGDGLAGNHRLPLPALAPKIDLRLAVRPHREDWHALGAAHRPRVQYEVPVIGKILRLRGGHEQQCESSGDATAHAKLRIGGLRSFEGRKALAEFRPDYPRDAGQASWL